MGNTPTTPAQYRGPEHVDVPFGIQWNEIGFHKAFGFEKMSDTINDVTNVLVYMRTNFIGLYNNIRDVLQMDQMNPETPLPDLITQFLNHLTLKEFDEQPVWVQNLLNANRPPVVNTTFASLSSSPFHFTLPSVPCRRKRSRHWVISMSKIWTRARAQPSENPHGRILLSGSRTRFTTIRPIFQRGSLIK